MAGIGSETEQALNVAPIGQIAPLAESVITPNAVSALTDAFRKGQITASDIALRHGQLAKTKEKAQIMGLDEMMSPESVQLRSDLIKSESGLARLKAAQAEVALPSVRRQQQVLDAETDNKFVDAMLHNGRYDLKRDAILSVGGDVPDFGTEGPTPAQKAEMDKEFKIAMGYRQNMKQAADFMGALKPRQQEFKETKGNQTKVTSEEIVDSPYGPIDKNVRLQIGAYGHQTLDQFKANPINFNEALTGKSFDGTSVKAKPTAAPAAKPVVGAAPATVGTEPGQYDESGRLITSVIEKEPTGTETTEKEKLYSQISNADQFAKKMDVARSQIHDAVIKPVGPMFNEGSRVAQIKSGIGAFLGVDSDRLKFKTQDELEQFLAQHVQATIRSMAGTGNKVMRAEIEQGQGGIGDIIGGHKVTGLFYQAAPKLTSTPETWDRWLNDLGTLFDDARSNALKALPVEEQKNFPPPTRVSAPGSATPTAGGSAPVPVKITGAGAGSYDPSTGKFRIAK